LAERISVAPRQVITISSQVAAGPVGNSAIVPGLLAMGVTPVAVPTILLSNHPGHGKPEGIEVPAERLGAMLKRLIELNFIREDAVILTGYFANAAQVDAVAAVIDGLEEASFICDPVLGDTPKGLYVPEDVAQGIKEKLVPMADVLTPNAFELGWITGRDVSDEESAHDACRQALWDKEVVVKSIPQGGTLVTALYEDSRERTFARPKLAGVPHGTGDLLSGLIAAQLALGSPLMDGLGLAVAQVERVIAASGGAASLDLGAGLKDIAAVEALRVGHE
jgi:pyridoxine kinase